MTASVTLYPLQNGAYETDKTPMHGTYGTRRSDAGWNVYRYTDRAPYDADYDDLDDEILDTVPTFTEAREAIAMFIGRDENGRDQEGLYR